MAESLDVRILVVDDDLSLLEALVDALKIRGYKVVGESCPEKGLARIGSWQPDVAIFDFKMPKMDGVELSRQVLEILPDLPILLLSGFATIGGAVQAIKEGVYDYLAKPFDVTEIETVVTRALDHKKQRLGYLQLAEAMGRSGEHEGIVGRGAGIKKVLTSVKMVADTDSIVLITGESGTGKELVARAVHAAGVRQDKPFITVDCAVIPDTLLESEMFGHTKGSFTGAHKDRAGKFEVASDGTIFLDEIGEIPLFLQKKLLRILQEKTFSRVGETRDRVCKARIVTATNRSLAHEVKEGRFREDLYYRLKVIEIHVPPLRERLEDVPLLLRHYLPLLNKRLNRNMTTVADDAMKILQNYTWPGNVRELINTLEQVMTFSDCKVLEVHHLPENLYSLVDPRLPMEIYAEFKERGIEVAGKAYFKALLIHYRGNVSRIAKHAEVDRRHLHRLLQKWELDATQFRNC